MPEALVAQLPCHSAGAGPASVCPRAWGPAAARGAHCGRASVQPEGPGRSGEDEAWGARGHGALSRVLAAAQARRRGLLRGLAAR